MKSCTQAKCARFHHQPSCIRLEKNGKANSFEQMESAEESKVQSITASLGRTRKKGGIALFLCNAHITV